MTTRHVRPSEIKKELIRRLSSLGFVPIRSAVPELSGVHLVEYRSDDQEVFFRIALDYKQTAKAYEYGASCGTDRADAVGLDVVSDLAPWFPWCDSWARPSGEFVSLSFARLARLFDWNRPQAAGRRNLIPDPRTPESWKEDIEFILEHFVRPMLSEYRTSYDIFLKLAAGQGTHQWRKVHAAYYAIQISIHGGLAGVSRERVRAILFSHVDLMADQLKTGASGADYLEVVLEQVYRHPLVLVAREAI